MSQAPWAASILDGTVRAQPRDRGRVVPELAQDLVGVLAARRWQPAHARTAGRELERKPQQRDGTGDRMPDLLDGIRRLDGGIRKRGGIVVHGGRPNTFGDVAVDSLRRP